jgi:hypothetical protein
MLATFGSSSSLLNSVEPAIGIAGPETTKNGLMHSGLFMCFLHDLNQLEYTDVLRFNSFVKACEEEPGLYDRYPAYDNKDRNNDKNAHDDACGVVAGGICADIPFHEEVLEYGLRHGFVYNNVEPGRFVTGKDPRNWEWWAFRGRFIKHIRWYFLVNRKLLILLPPLLLWLKAISFSKTVKYNVLLDYMIVKTLSVVFPSLTKFKNRWVKRAPLVESTINYFGANHPLSKLASEIVQGISP